MIIFNPEVREWLSGINMKNELSRIFFRFSIIVKQNVKYWEK